MPLRAGAETFVLVHGSFVGAWYWDPVKAGLEAQGHTVIAVDLTGDAALPVAVPAEVTLEQHIDDIVTAIGQANEPVILVAHSYGGRPATGAWDRARDRIKGVIFLEAVAPYGTGQIAIPEEVTQRQILAETAPQILEAGVIAPPYYVTERYPGRTVTPQSIKALHAPVMLTRGPLPNTPGAFVLGDRSDAPLFRQYAEKIVQQRGWTVYEIESGHDMVHDAGEVLVRLLMHVADEINAADQSR
jgi:pimeloyl-ACP methyl ester carboxylesterase